MTGTDAPAVAALLQRLDALMRTLKGDVPERDVFELDHEAGGRRYRARVQREGCGTPRVVAGDVPGAWFGLGYMMGWDRFVQMDLARSLAYGTLSMLVADVPLPPDLQVLGAKRVSDIDLFLRAFRFREQGEVQAAAMAGAERDRLEAFVEGINEGYRAIPGAAPEYAILNPPAPWTMADTVALSFVGGMLLDLASLDHEFLMNGMLGTLGAELLSAIYPQITVPLPDADALARVGRSFVPLVPVTGGGSNAWAVSGERSRSGLPLLASDPHLPISPIPSFWYHAMVECPELQVSGLLWPGSTAFAIGHNGHCAWGATAAQRDAFDTFRVRLSEDRSSWLSPDGWQPVEQVPVTIERRFRPRSPREEVLLTCPFGTIFPNWKAWDGSVIAVRMAGAAQHPSMEALDAAAWERGSFRVLTSTTWEEHREGLRGMSRGGVAIHHIYADVHGNIAHQLYGMYPRRPDSQGVVPRPTWEPGANWEGYVAFDDLPSELNPERGYVSSANCEPERELGDRTPGVRWPYLATVYEPPYRLERINALLDGEQQHDVEAARALQCDSYAAPQHRLAKRLAARVRSTVDPRDGRRERDRCSALARSLEAWDGCFEPDRPIAAVVELTLRRAAQTCWKQLLGEALGQRFGMTRYHLRRFVDVLEDPNDPLRPLLQRAGIVPDDVVCAAFREALKELRRAHRYPPHLLRYDKVHRVHLTHPLGAAPGLGALFNIGAFGTGGNEFAPNAMSATPGPGRLSSFIGPVSRFVCDLQDPRGGHWAHASGASGRTGSPYYASTTPGWLAGELVPARLSTRREG